MFIRKIFIYMSFILLVFNGNAFRVRDYDESILQMEPYLAYQSALDSVNKHLVRLTFYDNKNQKNINGYVVENFILLLQEFTTTSDWTESITYIYNQKKVIMSNFVSVSDNSHKTTFIGVSKNKEDFPSGEFSKLFLSYKSLYNLIKTRIKTFSNFADASNIFDDDNVLDILNQGLKSYKDYFFDIDNQDISICCHWFMAGSVINETHNYKMKIVPVGKISTNLYIYRVKSIDGIITVNNMFLYIKNDHVFNDNDIGSYLIYCRNKNNCNVYGQLINIKETSKHNQIISIAPIYTLINMNSNSRLILKV